MEDKGKRDRSCGMKGRRSPIQGQVIKGEVGGQLKAKHRVFVFLLKPFGGNSGFGSGRQEWVGESLLRDILG